MNQLNDIIAPISKVVAVTLLIILPASFAQAQTIWIADNNFNAPTGTNIFGTVQEAVNAASDGDIVYVQPSLTTYGNVTIDKPITLVGIGFNLTKDSPIPSTMGNITLTNNIAGSSDASGTEIKGLTFGVLSVGLITGPSFTLDGVTVDNCTFSSVDQNSSGYGPVSNLVVKWSVITGLTDFFAVTSGPTIFRNNRLMGQFWFRSTSSATDVIFANNLIYESIWFEADNGTKDIRNNNFIGASGSTRAFITELQNALVSNNIFFGRTPSISSGGSTSNNFQLNNFSNNLSFSTGDDTLPPNGGIGGNSGLNNLQSTSPDFTNAALSNSWSSSYDFTLMVGSLAINAGGDGTDIGVTGGPYPWALGNHALVTTPIPTIETLNATTVINPGDNLPVHIKAKGN